MSLTDGDAVEDGEHSLGGGSVREQEQTHAAARKTVKPTQQECERTAEEAVTSSTCERLR